MGDSPMTLITPEYQALQRELHNDPKYGVSSKRRVNDVLCLMERDQCVDVLDYGCGKGLLKQAIGDCVKEYDPAIPGKDGEPEAADLVVCTDVLEHIEPKLLDDVLMHIRLHCKKRLLFAISTRPAKKTLSDGRNAHLIIESAEWWREKLFRYFWITECAEGESEFSGVAKPVQIVGEIKSVGVMREERIAHVRANVIKTPLRCPDEPLPPHPGVALIACYGPSLNRSFELLQKQRKKLPHATLISVSGAHDFLRKRNLTPDIHIECDPRPHKGKMMRKVSKKTKYYMASCCHPDVVDQLKGHDVTLWHLYNGPESFEIRDIKSERSASMIPGGGSVGLRAITLLYFLGFRSFIVHGMDCSFDSEEVQHAGTHTGKVQKTITVEPAVTVRGEQVKSKRKFITSPVLISYANHMLKDLRVGRYPACNFFWYGDGLFQEMLRLQNLQLQAATEDQAAQGIEPTYIEARDYFSAKEEQAA